MKTISIILFTLIAIKGVYLKQIFKESKTFEHQNVPKQFLTKGHRAEEKINLSIPGTKWCGPGNTASDYNDLGEDFETDICCRAHDHCDNIPAGETKNNLTNDDYFTRLHCKCDKDFNDCLHSVNSKDSNRVGSIYFMLRSKCYKDEYPIVECIEYDTKMFIRRCIRYMLDESEEKKYQWFDLPLYEWNRSDFNWRNDLDLDYDYLLID